MAGCYGISARRACKLVGLWRSSWAYCPKPDSNAVIRLRLLELAAQYPCYGAPMLYQLLKREGQRVNHKRVERLYRLEGLSLRRRRRKRRSGALRKAMPIPKGQNEVWSADFIHDRIVQGGAFKCLTLIDHCTRESPDLHVARSIRGSDVVAVLERLRLCGRKPKVLVLDNGPEFTSVALARWAALHDVRLFFIEPGKPTQNAFIESFNGKLRNECLNQHWFATIEEAKIVIEAWRQEYETRRPHSGLSGRTPKEAAMTFQNPENKDLFVSLSLAQ